VARLGRDAEGYRDAEGVQGWTWSKPKISMGSIIYPAYKVFDEMPERKFLSNFGNSLGGSQSYNHRNGMVVVVVNLEKNCKMAKVR
jgi:hypothetical protein